MAPLAPRSSALLLEESRLRALIEHFVQTEATNSQLLDFLTQRLVVAIGAEIDAQIVRCSLHLPQQIDFLDCWLPAENGSNKRRRFQSKYLTGTTERKIEKIARDLARCSTNYKNFRGKTLDICNQLVNDLWRLKRTSGLGIEDLLNFDECPLNSDNNSHTLPTIWGDDLAEQRSETILALSSFSLLDHSQKELSEEEMASIVGIVISDELNLTVRQANLRKMLLISPLSFCASKSFEIFLGNLHSFLPIPELFQETMHVVSRILNCRDESIWSKTSICLCRVALNVMRRKDSLNQMAKRSLALFFVQIFFHGPRIWRSFSPQSTDQVVQSYIELLTAETTAGGGGSPKADGFLATFARADPRMDWIRPWLHDQQLRAMMSPKLAELAAEVLEGTIDKNSKLADIPSFWAFQCSLLLHCIRQLPLLQNVRQIVADSYNFERNLGIRLGIFISQAFSSPPHRKGFGKARKAILDGLMETSICDNGAKMLLSSGLLLNSFSYLLPLPSNSSRLDSIPLKVFPNVLIHFSHDWHKMPLSSLFAFAKYIRLLQFDIQNESIFPFEQRELTVQVLVILLDKYSPSEFINAFPDFASILPTVLPKFDPSIVAHRRLMISPSFLTLKNAIQLKNWRRKNGKTLDKLWLRQQTNEKGQNHLIPWLTFPLPIRPLYEERAAGICLLLKFIDGNGKGIANNNEQNWHSTYSEFQKYSSINFLESPSSDELPISPALFLLISQPGLLCDFFYTPEMANHLQRLFANFEIHYQQKGSQQGNLSNFLRRLDILIINLDFLAELKRFLPNFGARLVQMLQRFCCDSIGQPMICAISQQIGILLSHLKIASNAEMRQISIDQISQFQWKDIKLNSFENERKGCQNNEQIDWSKIGQEWAINSNSMGEEGMNKKEREFSMGLLEEDDQLFWLSLLPTQNTAKSRHELIMTIFSPKWQAKCRLSPFNLLRAFAQKFWHQMEGDREKMTLKPPPHSDWLPLIVDYGLLLGLAESKGEIRKKMGTLRLLESPPDWFISALFLASGLCADSTNWLCERFLHQSNVPKIGCIWPNAAPTDHPFDDQLALYVFPLVLANLRQIGAFHPVLSLLNSIRLPSLLHLLLFYVHRSYLGILPFAAVQEYLLLALIGGPEFQAFHFCSILAHICANPIVAQCRHFPSKFIRLFLRPEFLDDFSFAKYVKLMEEKEIEEKVTTKSGHEFD